MRKFIYENEELDQLHTAADVGTDAQQQCKSKGPSSVSYLGLGNSKLFKYSLVAFKLM